MHSSMYTISHEDPSLSQSVPNATLMNIYCYITFSLEVLLLCSCPKCIMHATRSTTRPKRNASYPPRHKKTPNLIPPPRRLRARTPRHAPLIPPPLLQPLLRPQLQLPLQLRTRFFPMNKIAEAAAHAPFAAVEPAARFAEVGDGGELAVDGARGVPA